MEVAGIDALRADMDRLSQATQRRIVGASIAKAADAVLRPAVVAASPAGTTTRRTRRRTAGGVPLGPLRKAWKVRLIRTPAGVLVQLASKRSSADAYYARFLELGWMAGRARTKAGAARRRRGRRFARHPFAASAAAAVFGRLVERTAAEMKVRVEAAASRGAR